MKHSKKVIGVAVCPVTSLSSLQRVGINRATIAEDPFTKLSIQTPATLELSSKKEDKNDIFTAKLTFICCKQRFDAAFHQAFKATLADRTEIIIGSSERPYPMISTSRNLSASDSDSQLLEVAVTYSSPLEMPILG